MYSKTKLFKLSGRFIWSLALMGTVLFSACSDDDNNNKEPKINEEISGAYFFNFGSHNNGGSSVTRYDFRKDETTNKYFETQNPGMTINSNIQYGAVYNDTIYLMGNASDEIISVNLEFKPTGNAVREGIEKPRFFVGEGDYLYISCLGANPDWKEMPDSYIAIYNTRTRKVEDKIALPGGPEGLAIVNGKLYAALNYRTQVAVIDLSTKAIEFIDMPAVSSYFLKDGSENLYVTLVSTHSNKSDKAGLGYINTGTGELEDNYVLEGVSSTYASILTTNSDRSTLYLVAAVGGEPGSIFAFDTKTGEFSKFIENLSGVNGVEINPVNKDIYVLQSGSVSEAGIVSIYNAEGTHQKDLNVGISPYWALFLD
jgi:hypothetical protein